MIQMHSVLDSRKFPSIFKLIAMADDKVNTSKGETEDKKTYSFPISGREEFIEQMQVAGYVENEQYQQEQYNGYFCSTCEYFVKDSNSITKFWCKKYKFPDVPHACCDGWELEEGKMLK